MEIITAHNNADLDALASMIAAHKIYPQAVMILPQKLSPSVKEVISLHKDAFPIKTIRDLRKQNITRLILVDTKDPQRVNQIGDFLDWDNIDIHLYDHHPWGEGDVHGSVEVVETVGAAVTLLIEIIQAKNIPVSSLEATIMALGIYADTGSLVYPSTTSRDALALAFLLKRGAKLAVLSEFLDRPLSEEQKKLLKDLLLSAEKKQVNGVRVLVAQATYPEFIVGLAMLTHVIVEIEKPEAAFIVVKMAERVHIVARSAIAQVNVVEIIRDFGGGGHSTPASASIKNMDMAEVMVKLQENIQKFVRPPLSAADIMSSPVKTVQREMSMAEVGHVMLRYGHSGVPVVEGNRLVGIISRRDVEKATQHGLSHAPVKGFMNVKVITVEPQIPVSEVRELMIAHDIGRVPVVENGLLIGLVSRTDVLKTLHGDYDSKYQKIYSEASNEPEDNLANAIQRGLSRTALNVIRQAGFLAVEMGYQLYVAGGLVRDLLLGYDNVDLDLVVEGDGIALAEKLAEKLFGRLKAHPRFRTAEISLPGGMKVDVATARVEFYEYPAALPQVESSSLRQDLYRRDFTINAMAIALNPDRFGELIDHFGGEKDLQEGLVRILYNLSFVEDPTRMLRAIRFEQRYQIQIEAQTLALLQEAVEQRVLANVSCDRIRCELNHIFEEVQAAKMLERINELGLWPQLFEGVDYQKAQAVLPMLHYNCERLKTWGIKGIKDYSLIFWMGILHTSSLETTRKIFEYYYLGYKPLEKVEQLIKIWPEILAELSRPDMDAVGVAKKLLALVPEAWVVILALLPGMTAQENLQKLLLALQDTRIVLNGKGLQKMGFKPGPLYKQALDYIWQAKVGGLVHNLEEEKALARKFFIEKGVKPEDGLAD